LKRILPGNLSPKFKPVLEDKKYLKNRKPIKAPKKRKGGGVRKASLHKKTFESKREEKETIKKGSNLVKTEAAVVTLLRHNECWSGRNRRKRKKAAVCRGEANATCGKVDRKTHLFEYL